MTILLYDYYAIGLSSVVYIFNKGSTLWLWSTDKYVHLFFIFYPKSTFKYVVNCFVSLVFLVGYYSICNNITCMLVILHVLQWWVKLTAFLAKHTCDIFLQRLFDKLTVQTVNIGSGQTCLPSWRLFKVHNYTYILVIW